MTEGADDIADGKEVLDPPLKFGIGQVLLLKNEVAQEEKLGIITKNRPLLLIQVLQRFHILLAFLCHQGNTVRVFK